MSFEPVPPQKPRLADILPYLLSAVSGLLAIVILLLMRSLILAILFATHVNVWAWGALDKFSFILLAILWLIFVLFSQYFYERGLEKRILWSRFGRVFGLEVLVLVLISVGLAFVT